MLKRKVTLLVAVIMMIGLMTLPTSAQKVEVSPMFTHIVIFDTGFTITSGGQAQVDCSINAFDVDKCKVVVNLQQWKNGGWTTIKSWSDERLGESAFAYGSIYVTKGYNYQVKSYGYVYQNGVCVDSTSYTSNTIYY